MIRVKIITTLVFIIISLVSHSNPHQDWPNSRDNAQMHGYTKANFLSNPDIKWVFDADWIFKSAPVVYDEKVIIGSTEGTIYCLDMEGRLIWKKETDNSIEAPALIVDGIVYLGNLSGSLYALDIETGNEKWIYTTENQIMGAPNHWKNKEKEYLLVGSYDFFLHCIDLKTGKGVWKYESDNYLNGAPAISDGKALFGGCDGLLHVVDIATGKADYQIEVASYVASSPLVLGTMAFVGDYEGGFSGINLKNQEKVWNFSNPDANLPFIASPALSKSHIIIGNRDKFVYCIDNESGKLVWSDNTGSRVEASAVVNNKQALVFNMRGDMLLYDVKDGSKIYTYELGTPVMNTPAVIDGKIIVGGMDGNIYMLAD